MSYVKGIRLIGSIGFVMGIGATALSASAAEFGLPDFSQLVEANAPTVVNISTHQNGPRRPTAEQMPELPDDSPFKDFFEKFFEDMPQGPDSRSLGSGFIVSSDGYVMTNAHVVANADDVTVRLADGRELSAEIVGADRRSDVALLKVDATDLKAVTIGNDADLKVGEWVLAIGSPFGFESTATAGIVSAKGRSLPNENYIPFIQTDVAINPGNSGGPLFNLDGEVIGVNAQIYSRTGGFMGLSFAVPISMAMSIAEQLKSKGRVTRGWLGVAIQTVTQELAESFAMERPRGALITEILPDSPAATSELEPGDVIVGFNDHPINKMSELPPVVGNSPVGAIAKVEIIRNGKREVVDVRVGELPTEQEVAEATSSQPPAARESLLGLVVDDLSEEDKQGLGLPGGVIVTEVEEGPAAKAGVRGGDVILGLDGEDVNTVDDFRRIAGKLDTGRSTPILIRRGERSLFLALKPSE